MPFAVQKDMPLLLLELHFSLRLFWVRITFFNRLSCLISHDSTDFILAALLYVLLPNGDYWNYRMLKTQVSVCLPSIFNFQLI
jgi:hypothetical protein